MRLLNARAQRGLTLIELLVTVTIIGLLALKGLPELSNYLANAKLRETANNAVTAAAFARNEAIKRNATVNLVSTGTSMAVVDTSSGATVRTYPLTPTTQLPAFTARFDSAGRLLPFGTEVQAQVTSTSAGSCGQDIRCPTVRLESGGAASICKEGACS